MRHAWWLVRCAATPACRPGAPHRRRQQAAHKVGLQEDGEPSGRAARQHHLPRGIHAVLGEEHVEQVLNDVPLQPGSLVIDCTSGDPVHTQALAARLLSERGIRFTDAPVSGGPTGAAAGTVTSMVGGAPEDVAEAMPLIKAWSKKVVHCGPVGAGDATKSVNNVLNSAHLLLATEGMVS